MNRSCNSKFATTASILLVFVLLTVPSCAQTTANRITAGELNAIIANRQVVVVDVRDSRDWGRSDQKIKGAIRLDPAKLDPTSLPIAKTATLVLY